MYKLKAVGQCHTELMCLREPHLPADKLALKGIDVPRFKTRFTTALGRYDNINHGGYKFLPLHCGIHLWLLHDKGLHIKSPRLAQTVFRHFPSALPAAGLTHLAMRGWFNCWDCIMLRLISGSICCTSGL